ncbi:hypothetical protein QTP88_026950 [Uroleucon formosanum]
MLTTVIDNGANGNGMVVARALVRKKRSKGCDVISIESRTYPKCYVLLNREDLLSIQKLEYCIRDSVTRKTLITLPEIVKQLAVWSDIWKQLTGDEGCSDPGYANEIKMLSANALAHLWYGQDVCGLYGMDDEQTAPPLTPPSLHKHTISEALETVDMGNDIDTSYSPPTPSFPEIDEQKCSNMTSPRRPMSPSSFLAGYEFY